jgi:hypothetical protein
LDFDISGLQIAVNDSGIVSRGQRLRQLFGNRNSIVERDRTTRDALREVVAVDQLHH